MGEISKLRLNELYQWKKEGVKPEEIEALYYYNDIKSNLKDKEIPDSKKNKDSNRK